MPDGPRPSPHGVTWEQLRDGAEASWPLEGPSSQGGTTLYCYRGWLFVVGYGEQSRLAGGAEQILSSRPDDAAGFPPALPDGHAAGCVHDEWRGADWWRHRTSLLELQGGTLRLFEGAEPVWTCPAETLLRDDSAERGDVLARLGPAVLDEALRCASRARP